MNTLNLNRIAFIGDYLPRQCGIATFTSDICETMAARFPNSDCIVGALNDRPEGYDYPSRVSFEIEEKELDSYRRAADFLNINNVEVVSIQHEFGIFGGLAGSHIIDFMRDLHMPIVTTLHTVLSAPNTHQLTVMKRLNELSNRFIVMAERGRHLLETVYGVDSNKIDLIPHGVPDVQFIDPSIHKDQFGVEGKTVLLTFGLLSPNKGIEYVIQALPAILAQHPNVVYIVLGATHPNLRAHEGESYRLKLERLAKDLGVSGSVIFYNRFVTFAELTEFIGAADIYITPYLNADQITSGTLAYAFGAGKAVISTAYAHAQELLTSDRGILVPFSDAEAIANGVNRLLSDSELLYTMRKNAWDLGREMIWPVVADRYMKSFQRARATTGKPSRKAFAVRTLDNRPYELPLWKLDHLFRMSDDTGIFQHAIFNVPNYSEGYCTDDNARAYILTLLLPEMTNSKAKKEIEQLSSTYLAFLWDAFDKKTSRFRNFMSHKREWLEVVGSEDSQGRALWAAGVALGRSQNEGHRNLCALMFQQGLPIVETFTSPRSWAFALLAIHEYLRAFSGDRNVNQLRDILTTRLLDHYIGNSTPEWHWFEVMATYDNAKLSHAMILSGYWTSRGDVFEIGLKSLRWLIEVQKNKSSSFKPIGSNGFWIRGQECAAFDQQPLEAHSMISACLEAYYLTKDEYWLHSARCCFEWFLGRNDLGLALYDSSGGGCRDSLHQDRTSHNQGAESSLAFYLSLAEMSLSKNLTDH